MADSRAGNPNFLSSTWRRDVDDGGVRVDLALGLRHGVEDGEAEVELAALPRGHAPHHVRPVLDGLAIGLEKTRVKKNKKKQPIGFFGVFLVFWGFFGFNS
jgi:hypothetical protein